MTQLIDGLRMVPPQNLEAESSVLGAILLETEALQIVKHHLDATDFYRESHGKIFVAMNELVEQREPVDLITLSDFLKRKDELEGMGGDFLPGITRRLCAYRRQCRVIRQNSTREIFVAETPSDHPGDGRINLFSRGRFGDDCGTGKFSARAT